MAATVVFDLALEHGRCVGVTIPESDDDLDGLLQTLAPAERAHARELPGPRRRTWAGGRAAMREVLGRLNVPLTAVAADDRGAPILPEGLAGSISHKERTAVALIAFEPWARVGVDLELDVVRAHDIASRVLLDTERRDLEGLDPPSRAREVILRFSAKESIYKALDPFVRRYVDFKEVSVSPRADGGATVTSRLRCAEGPFLIDVRWRRFDGIVLTTARVEPGGQRRD